jgi:hypothetical protein
VIDVDPDSYHLLRPGFGLQGLVPSQVGPLRREARDGDMRQSQYHFVWPNTTINISPGP